YEQQIRQSGNDGDIEGEKRLKHRTRSAANGMEAAISDAGEGGREPASGDNGFDRIIGGKEAEGNV
ncbi:MAG: hypothetical protein J6X34_03270, partial [Clostridia bacterium]|nr:hypothetical protein [Clostridia bacterium]